MLNRDECLSQYRYYCQSYVRQHKWIADMADVGMDNIELITKLNDRLFNFKKWFEHYYSSYTYPETWDDISDIKFGPINI